MMKSCIHATLIMVITMAQASAAVDDRRRGFSFLSLGLSLVDYEESSTLRFNGQTVDVENSTAQLGTKNGGAYVSVNDRWGFYLQSTSTLGVPRSEETWEVEEELVRTNRVSFERQDISLMATRRISNTSHWLLGGSYEQFEFQRFAAELQPGAASFGLDEDDLVNGTVSEVITHMTGVVGWETSTVFNSKQPGWRYQARALLAIPALTAINNTSVADGRSFNTTFNGVGMVLTGVVGYQLNESVLIGGELVVRLRYQDTVARDVVSIGGQTQFPKTRFLSAQPALTVYWSF